VSLAALFLDITRQPTLRETEMTTSHTIRQAVAHGALAAAALLATHGAARADAVTDWNQRSAQFITEARLGTPPAVRVMAVVQTAAYEAAREAGNNAAVSDAAIAAAHRVALGALLPAQRATIDAAAQAALTQIGDEAARVAGAAIGERAAQRVLEQRAGEMPRGAESYRPHTTPGAYVPTATPAVPLWPQRRPWLMASAAQFRPAPPPALSSDRWARDYNEAKQFGGKESPQRTPEQTEIARFWDYSLPAIYHGVVRSVAQQGGRSALANARLFAAVAQGMDDALIAVFEAKYHYNFWRPATAIRNGDIDGHDATEREAAWSPLIDVPMHPEYPSGHSIVAATVATVIDAELAGKPAPPLATSSPTANNTTRRWNSTESFVREVSMARVWGGLHFRSATDAGEAMGRRIGTLAAQQVLGHQP
jgi:PAP2 superfamily